MKKAIYPGTFDPFTLGHLDVINRATLLFDELIIGVSESKSKKTFIPFEQRVSLLESSINGTQNVHVVSFHSLLVDFCVKEDCFVIVRGLRTLSDFEYEFQMALTNRSLNPNIETVFIMAGEKFSYISSSMIREIYEVTGDLTPFVPEPVKKYLSEHYENKN